MRALKLASVVCLALVASAHVGSPDVFFTGHAGPYVVRVTIRPPAVVPGIAHVTVRTSPEVNGVFLRPVFWRAGSRGAPSADATRRLAEGRKGGRERGGGRGDAQTFDGSLWRMARGAYTVDVIVTGTRGTANVLVPVASVATGRLAISPGLGVMLVLLGVLLCAGLVNIVYKGAGESLVGPSDALDAARRRRARRAAAIAVPIVALGVFGGARWWGAVDHDYERTMYRPAPLKLSLSRDVLRLETTDTLWQPPGRPSALIKDHGKLMHLFLIRQGDARAFAHLHPEPADTSIIPAFVTKLPPLPAGTYRVYGDVVHETGFERTLVGSVTLQDSSALFPKARTDVKATGRRELKSDPDDAWFVGEASREKITKLADGSTMELQIIPNGLIQAEREETIRITVRDSTGRLAALEPYLGMMAHGVVTRVDGAVYVHLHPMGTITTAAQDAFLARDRGDTTSEGRLLLEDHMVHDSSTVSATSPESVIEFPYAFPTAGSYRLFVQVKRSGRVLTGAYAITVTESAAAR